MIDQKKTTVASNDIELPSRILNTSESRSVVRDSNMELLRIVAMTMILCGHMLTHGLKHVVKHTPYYFALEPWFICGVNLFFLISGWYGMRYSTRSLVKLVSTTFFFIVVNIVLLWLFGVEVKTATITNAIFFPVSRGLYWFIMVYMALMLLSPILNAGISNVPPKVFTGFVALFTAFNLYSCWGGQNYVNVEGFTIVQGIWMYCLARWLRFHSELLKRLWKGWYMAAFIVFTLMTIISGFVFKVSWLQYNAPFVMLASVSLLVFFSRLELRKRWINKVAISSLGCYLLQDGLWGRKYFYNLFENSYIHISETNLPIVAIMQVVVILLGTIVMFWLGAMFLMPVASYFNNKVARFTDRLKANITFTYFAKRKKRSFW